MSLNLISTALYIPILPLVLPQLPGHAVQHPPHVGVVGLLHQYLAEALNKPCSFLMVPDGDIARYGGVSTCPPIQESYKKKLSIYFKSLYIYPFKC